MASRTLIVVSDDLDGTELTDGSGTTLSFSVGTTQYEIDLSAKNHDKFTKALKPYTDAARIVRTPRSSTRTRRPAAGASADPVAVRAWAAENGVEVSARGRIPAGVLDQYRAAGN